MTDNLQEYKDMVAAEAKNWIDDNYQDYDDWDSLWDDMTMDVTGNNGSIRATPLDLIHAIVWDGDFIQYCAEACTDVGEVMSRGTSVTDCYARYMIFDWFLNNELNDYWENLVDNY